MNHLLKALLLSSLAFSGFALAQNPFTWINNLVNTEERLLHQVELGPYTLNAQGQRLLHDPYLRLSINLEGEPIPADSSVRVDSTLFVQGGQTNKSYTPEHDGKSFVITPLDLEKAKVMSWDEGGWLRLAITVNGPAGPASETVGISIYPPKPAVSFAFRALNFLIPLVLVAVFAIIFKVTNIRLRRSPQPV